MAKIRTKNKINWGGFDPSKLNHVEVEIKEVSKTSESVTFLVKDTVIGENEYIGENEETLISEYPFQVIREKRFSVPMELYNQLYSAVESQIPTELTPFEKEQLRPKMALLFYFSNDTLANGLCGYNTTPNDWEIV
jgi:site-specific DNA-adenine methylase